MSQKSHLHALLLVTHSGSPAAGILQTLHKDIACKLLIASPHDHRSVQPILADILLFDNDAMTLETMQQWQPMVSEITRQAILNVVNSPSGLIGDYLLDMPIEGIFYRNDSKDILCQGINTLLAGNMWISRELSARLLSRMDPQQKRHELRDCDLSRREQEVAELMIMGASNREISERLFVSLHTVKSHLHNIFRKINVGNRRQALNHLRNSISRLPR